MGGARWLQQIPEQLKSLRAWASGETHDRSDGTAALHAIAAPELQTRLTNNLLDREDDDRPDDHK